MYIQRILQDTMRLASMLAMGVACCSLHRMCRRLIVSSRQGAAERTQERCVLSVLSRIPPATFVRLLVAG
jgi:hypothetical protein